MLCDNDSSMGRGISLSPQCWKKEATKKVTVTYTEFEQETFYLCEECTRALKKDARKHGYRVRTQPI